MTRERWQQVKGVLEQAIGLNPAQLPAFLDHACQGDSPLRREVESLLLGGSESMTGFLEQPAVLSAAILQDDDKAWVGRYLGPYRVIERIGEGGMGSIYRASRADEQYKKEVAVKVVKRGFDTPFTLARFRAERQILANLDHPNIARLLDGGTTENGLPYVVMELVQGPPIDHYCNSHRLSIEERLRLFRTVCLAVQYAHQHMVIHRDLKPGNILVTADGTPKLLDFGIAKILDPESFPGGAEATVSFMHMLTPEYASPEQVRGETIAAASDVYSLGVVLFVLLTGCHPYRFHNRSADAIASVVCETDPLKPSAALRLATKVAPDAGQTSQPGIATKTKKLSRWLRGDLDNIVLMALRKDPRRRYASAAQLAEDIRCHLDNLPVMARKDTAGYRVSKFTLRHKTGSALAAATVLLLVGALFITLREASVARLQARIASEQRERAQKRFNDVRTLANSLIFDVHDSIQDLPGSTSARKLIVEKALQYLDSLANESKDDPSLRRELASAYQRVGDVQGGPFVGNLGDSAGALDSYQKALDIRQRLLAENPGSIADALAFAGAARSLSNVLTVSDRTASAFETLGRAASELESFLPDYHNLNSLLQELMLVYGEQADLLASNLVTNHLNRAAAAFSLRQKQLQIAEKLASSQLDNTGLQANLASSLGYMGDQWLLEGDRREAATYYLRSLRMFERLASQSNGTRILHSLHDSYYRLQGVQLADAQLSQSAASSRRALQIAEKLSSADPKNVQFLLILAADYCHLADVLSRSGDADGARSFINRSLRVDEELVRRNPKSPEFHRMQTLRFHSAGDVAHRLGEYSKALQYYQEASEALAQIYSRDTLNAGARLEMAAVFNGAGTVRMVMHDIPEARKTYRRALDLSLSEATSPDSNEDALYVAATSYAGLADVEAALAQNTTLPLRNQIDHWQRAKASYQNSLDIWRKVKEPGLVSPEAFDCIPQSVVSQELAQSEDTLRRLTEANY